MILVLVSVLVLGAADRFFVRDPYREEAGLTEAGGGETDGGESGGEGTEGMEPGSAEAELLRGLYLAMERGMLTQAAELLNENEDQFKRLLEETFDGRKYLFSVRKEEDGTAIDTVCELTEDTAGNGLVLTRFNTVFFGNFAGGKPEGDCLAIQTMVLDLPRYTYADGRWKDGKMNGPGTTGYRYYEETPEGSFTVTEKVGTYADNLLTGEFTYRVENQNGEALTWHMEAEGGVTVLSDHWTHYEFKGDYLLPSEEDEERAYVLPADRLETVMWNNLILWDE